MTQTPPKPPFSVKDWDEAKPEVLEIEWDKEGDKPTPEELAFLERVWILHNKVARLAGKERRNHFWSQITGAAGIGLGGELPTGAAGLRRVEREFVEVEGPILRQRFLTATLAWGVSLFAIALIAALNTGGCSAEPMVGCVSPLLFDVAWIAAGIGLGMIFFAYVSSIEITYDNIGRFDPTALGPPLRLGFICVVAIALAVILLSGAVTIGFGQFSLNAFQENSIVAFLLGFFAAYSDVQTARLISSVLDRGATNAARPA